MLSLTLLYVLVISILHETQSENFHLHHIDYEQNINYYDCLYSYSSVYDIIYETNIVQIMSIIPYCIRSLFMPSLTSCQNNVREYTFEQLKSDNVTGNDLYQWKTPIIIIDLYQKYLDTYDIQIATHIYCNCTKPWFGQYCQYTFDTSLTFEEIIRFHFPDKSSGTKKNFIPTCYEGLNCSSTRFCLDWRQVCNNIIDCDNGEDEQNCIELEVNECDLNSEYRCKSGMCIEKEFAFDLSHDCIDNSDEEYRYFTSKPSCSSSSSIQCEEHNCAWMKFSCGDGTCDDYCSQHRDFFYRKSLFYSTNNNTDKVKILCHDCLICKIEDNIPDIYRSKLTENQCKQLNCEKCGYEKLVLYPHPFMYPSVNFLYLSIQIIPSYICYNTDQCPLFAFDIYIFYDYQHKTDLNCQKTTDFYWLDTQSNHYNDFFLSVQKTFSFCPITENKKNIMINSNNIFPCHNTSTYLSKYRINDLNNDCLFADDEQVYSRNDLCNIKKPQYRFHCITSRECINRQTMLYDSRAYDFLQCKDLSNQLMPLYCATLNDLGCQFLRGISISIDYFLFQELCNDIPNENLINGNDTDETHCDEWKQYCRLRYNSRICKGYFYSPILYNTSYENYHIKYCSNKYHPLDFTRVFHCSNICIRIDQLCDGKQDCDNNEDELLCPSRIQSQCPQETFNCGNGKCKSTDVICNNQDDCYNDQIGEFNDEKYCNLIPKMNSYMKFSFEYYNQYPQIGILPYEQTTENLQQELSYRQDHLKFELKTNISSLYFCHRGILAYNSNRNEVCFCSPAYFGDQCQYQRERLTIFLRLETIIKFDTNVYKIFIRLQKSTNVTYDSIDFVFSGYNQTNPYKYIVYLLTPGLNEEYNVIIDIFHITITKIYYHSSYYYPVSFTFLPVNRLAKKIIIDNTNTTSMIKCNKTCSHGICMSYINLKNEFFCLCDQGWKGEFCDEEIKKSNCSSNSLAYHSFCICPIGHYGKNCYAKIDLCQNIDCKNNGTCVSVDIKAQKFVCHCQKEYFGDYCQYTSAKINIHMKDLWNDKSFNRISLILVYFVNITNDIGLATIHDRQLYQNIPINSIVTSVFHKKLYLSSFVFVQIYFNTQFDTIYGSYYLVTIAKYSTSRKIISTSIFQSHRCPFVGELLNNETIMSYSYMRRIKYYHRTCFVLDTRCWYDEYYMCLCNNEAYFDCFRFSHSDSHCMNTDYCMNSGYCFQPMKPTKEFSCVCPKCYYGNLCQFSTTQYSISLDALLGEDILQNELLSKQPTIIKMIFSFIVLIVIFGLISNLLSIVTFCQSKTRELGCGLYLLSLSVNSLLGLLVFLSKFLYLLVTQIGIIENIMVAKIMCVLLEFLLSAVPTIFDWLFTCIAIERVMIVIKGCRFEKRRSIKYAKYVISCVITINFLLSLHELFIRRLVNDPQSKHRYWCVADYKQKWIEVYEKTINIVSLIVPFVINVITTVIILISIVRRKSLLSTNKDNNSSLRILKEQILLYKSFIIAPFLIILLELPRLILIFSLACIKISRQKYFYLTSYLLSILPWTLTLLIFVLTKETYKEELNKYLTRIKTRFISKIRLL